MDLGPILSILTAAPTEATLILASLVVLTTIWFRSRDIDISSVTSISKIQRDQIAELIAQNRELSSDLATLRRMQAQTHEVMAEMRTRVVELEELVRHYQSRCTHCPDRAPPPRG